MILVGFVSSITTMHIVLLTLCAYTSSAPAHHLTIGVQGNTPTLFVTSSEIGIPSETERSRLKPSKVQKDFKSTEKSKYQKTKTSANYKKGKSIYFTKNVAATVLPTGYLKPNRTPDTLVALGTLKGIETHTDIPKSTQGSETTANIEQTVLVTLAPITFAIANCTPTTETAVNDDNYKRKEERTTEKEHIQLLGTTAPIVTESLTIKSPTESAIEATATTTSTTSSLSSAFTDIYGDGEITTADSEVMENVTYRPSDALEVSASTTAASSDIWSTSEDIMQSGSKSETTETNDVATETQTENTIETETLSSMQRPSQETKVQILGIESTTIPATTESILKLIDLEKEKHNAKTFETFSPHGVGHDNGHDGLKNIKKKQLVDSHFLEVSLNGKPAETQMTEDTSTVITTKHGFLGPILMEEKTFHVIHGNMTVLNETKQPLAVDSQLRHSNFVEIKPTTTDDGQDGLTSAVAAAGVSMGQFMEPDNEESSVMSSTTFDVPVDTVVSKTPSNASINLMTSTAIGHEDNKSESKISDIQIEVYDSTVDSIVASTNFKDNPQGKTTKPPVSAAQQERFTQYIIDRTETSTQESINFSTIQVASGMPEPAAIEIHINVSESFSNDAEDLDISFPQGDYSNNAHAEDAYDEKDDIKLKVPSNTASSANKDRSDEILVVEIVDNGDNGTESKAKSKALNDMNLPHLRQSSTYSTPPPPPPPPPYQGSFDRDSDTIFYISNTEVKVGESPPSLDERKIKLENQFFPANYMASTHPNINTADDHHLYEEDIILSSDRNQADSLKIYRNRNEPSPPLDVTYVGESIIEVEQSPDSGMTTTLAADHVITPQPDVIIQPAILPEISIGVPVIGELPPQIELKEIDFMPNEAQLHRSGLYGNEETNGLSGISGSANVDNRLDDSSIQYGGDLIDESADGGFDGVEGSYPFGNPATLTQHKQSHVADYAHLYINYGVNNMRKDELSADIKDSAEVNVIIGNAAGSASEQNATSKEFMNRVALNNITSLNESERMSNNTAFSIEDPTEIDDKNTEDIINLISLAIGLFIVILPVVVTCSMLWALRYLYKKYHSTSTDSNGNLDPADVKRLSSGDAAEKGECEQEPCSPSPRIDKDDIQKCTETYKEPSIDNSFVKFSAEQTTHVDSSVDLHCKMYSCSSKSRDCPLLLPLNPPAVGDTQIVHDEILPGPNGSVTKMTLENNLLIVETEERNDISRVARETKMDYNKDGVFVVEVARGIDSRTIPESPVTEGSEKMLSMFETKHNGSMGYKLANEKVSHNNEKVQIHSPPPEKNDDGPRSLHQIEEVDEPVHSPRLGDAEEEVVHLNYKSNTGLSQSDLSSTSSNDSNKDYCYGNQELYVVEQTGYSTSSPTANVVPKCDTKDIKDDDQNSENGPYLEHSPHKEEDARETEDIMDTVNRHSENETFDEKHMVQGEKEADNDVGKENYEKVSETNKDQTMCNGHLEANEIYVGDKVSRLAAEDFAIETKIQTITDLSNSETLNGIVEKSRNAKEDLLKSVETDQLTVSGLNDEIIVVDIETEVLSDVELLKENVASKSVETDLLNGLKDEIIIVDNESEVVPDVEILQQNVAPKTIETDHLSVNGLKDGITIADIETEVASDVEILEENVVPKGVLKDGITVVDNEIEVLSDLEILKKNVVPTDYIELIDDHITKSSENGQCYVKTLGIISEESLQQTEDPAESDAKYHLHLNGTVQETILDEVKAKDHLHLNGSQETVLDKRSCVVNDALSLNGTPDKSMEHTNGDIDNSNKTPNMSEHLRNGAHILPDVVPFGKVCNLKNGVANYQVPSIQCTTEFENGYDSIMSLPDPPTSDEVYCGDLSEQQLDSLPPPPPPMLNDLNGETFNLKDLPPPLTNCETECLPNEDSTNYYSSLPPPPPTTLDVSATTTPTTNGNMHASPLTPPASPPPHFTNGLHTAMCPPIAVDVNGS